MAPSYTKTSNIENTLNRAAEQLKDIEKRFNSNGKLSYGGSDLYLSQYDSKALEVVLPNKCIDDKVLEFLNDFKNKMKDEGIDIWYCITN